MSSSIRIAAILALVLASAGGPAADGLRPSIPSPGGGWKPPTRPAVKRSPRVKPFPAKEINKLLGERGYARTRFVQERLRRILPPGRYKFDSKCPLVKRSPATDPLTRRYPMYTISCLDADHQEYLAVPIEPNKGTDGWKLLFLSPQSARITGTFLLSIQKRRWDESRAASIDDGGSDIYNESGEIVSESTKPTVPRYYNYIYHASTWLWKQGDFRFENPFLGVLKKASAGTHYDRFGTVDHFARVLPRLLKEAVKRSKRKSKNTRWTEQFLAVVPVGRWLPFYAACPLEVVRPPRRESADGRLWMSLRLSCLGKGRFSSAEILLEESFFRNYPDFAPVPGQRFIADLKFGGISQEGRGFRMNWETINNIRPVSKK